MRWSSGATTSATATRRSRSLRSGEGVRPTRGPQGRGIRVQGREGPVLSFCASNYLGLSGRPDLLASAHRTLHEWGYGLSSVRFICGTQALRLELEQKVAAFLGMGVAILY